MTPRMFEALALLREGAPVKQLARRLGVCLKTVRRDLVEIREAGFELFETIEDYGRKVWRVRRLDSTLKQLTTQAPRKAKARRPRGG